MMDEGLKTQLESRKQALSEQIAGYDNTIRSLLGQIPEIKRQIDAQLRSKNTAQGALDEVSRLLTNSEAAGDGAR